MILCGALGACAAACLLVLAAGRATSAPVPLRAPARSLVRRAHEYLARERAAAACLAILQATHAGLRGGLPLVGALRQALVSCDELGRRPFRDVLRSFELNAGLDDALVAARARTHDARVVTALDALALVASEQLASARAASLIGSVADRLAFDAHLREEVDARASGARTQIVILALIVPALAVYLVITLPGLGATLATPIGTHILVPAALVLELAGIVASRSIVKGLEL